MERFLFFLLFRNLCSLLLFCLLLLQRVETFPHMSEEGEYLELDVPSSAPVEEPADDANVDEELMDSAAQGGDDDISDEGDYKDDEAAADAGETANTLAEVGDSELLTLDKKQAKLLGKKLYKRWKKLMKKVSGDKQHSKKHKKEDKKKDKTSDKRRARSGEEAGSSSKRSSKKRSRQEANASMDEYHTPVDHSDGTAAALIAASSLQAKEAKLRVKATMTQAQRIMRAEADAAAIVALMREKRAADESARRLEQPPLHRFGIMEDVARHCRRRYMQQYLVACGVLEELSRWLYDPVKSELGPLDLRTLALSLLVEFEVRGMPSTEKLDDDEDFEEGKAKKKVDDLTKYRGICREDLEGCSIGAAVNKIRMHPQELQRNKALATHVLQRLSRAFRVRRDDDAEPQAPVEVQWKCKGDSDVAPPFDPVIAASDEFQMRMFKPDPLDPLSYLRLPPKRYQKGYVTNLSHIQV